VQPELTCPDCFNTEGEKILGYQVRGAYDGTMFWVCLVCGIAWPRDFGTNTRLVQQSKGYASWYNNRSERAAQ
jgi:hypothetical protein